MHGSYGICAFDGNGILRYASKTLGDFDSDGILGQPVWHGCDNEDAIRNAFALTLMTGKPTTLASRVTDPSGVVSVVTYTFFRLPLEHHIRMLGIWAEPMSGPELSAQELNCLELLSRGMRQDAIAERLHVSDSTVKSALSRACQKLGARTTTHAVALAVRHGLI